MMFWSQKMDLPVINKEKYEFWKFIWILNFNSFCSRLKQIILIEEANFAMMRKNSLFGKKTN